MSFPRAKIQRFNDATTCAPAPGSYDPKFDSKVKGTVIHKSERFVDPKSLHTGQEGEIGNLSKASSLNCLPVFRTPQLPRKVQKSSSKQRGRETPDRKDSCSDSEDIVMRQKELFPECPELASLKVKLAKTLKDFGEADEKCASLYSTVDSQKSLIEELEQRNVALVEEVQHLQLELCTANARHQESVVGFEKSSEEYLVRLKEMRSMLEERTFGFEDEIRKVRGELEHVTNFNSDLEQKLSQKQQMILLLQSELSNAEVELVECRSECERISSDFCAEKSLMTDKHISEQETLHVIISELEERLEKERDDNIRQVQILRDNLMNSSVVRDTLETTLAEKEMTFWTMETRYDNLLAECEDLKQAHTNQAEEIKSIYESKIKNNLLVMSNFLENHCLDLKSKCDDKLVGLERKFNTVFRKSCLEWQGEITRLKSVNSRIKEMLEEVKAQSEEESTALKIRGEAREQELALRVRNVEAEARIITEKLLQTEEELRKVSMNRDELRVSNMENQLTVVDLQDKLDTLATEKNLSCETLAKMSVERDALKSQNKVLTVGNRNLNESLGALRVRLLDSERDVERLTALNENIKTEELALRQQINTVREELENQRTNIAKMEADNMQQIEGVRMDLLGKLESLKSKAILDSESMQKVDAEKQRQIQGLSIQLEIFRTDFQELSKYVTAMELENEEQSRQIQALDAQGKQLEDMTVRLALQEEAYCTLTSTFKKQAADLEQCRIELLSAQGKISSKEEEILEYKCNMEQMSADIESTEARISELHEAMNSMEDTNSDHEREIEALTEKLDHQRDCAKLANQQIAAFEASHTLKDIHIQALSSELEDYKEYINQATEHMRSLVNVNNEKDKQIESSVEEIEALKITMQDTNNKVKEFSEQLSSVREKLMLSAEEIKLLEADRFVKEEQVKELLTDLSCQQKCSQEFANQIAALEKLQIKKQSEVENSLSKIVQMDSERNVTEQSVKDLANDLENAVQSNKNEINKRQAVEKKLADIESKVSKLSEAKADLELMVHELTRKNGKLSADAIRDRAHLETANSELVSQKLVLEDVLTAKQKELDLLKVLLDNHRQKVDEQSRLFETKLEKDTNMLKIELKKLTKDNEKLREESSRNQTLLEKSNISLAEDKTQLEDILKSKVSELNSLKAKCQSLQQTVEEQSVTLVTQLKDLSEVKELETEFKNLTRRNERLIEENTQDKADLESKINAEVAEKMHLVNALSSKTEELDSLQDTCKKLQQEIEKQSNLLKDKAETEHLEAELKELRLQVEELNKAKQNLEEQLLMSEKRYNEVESLIGPFKEQLEAYRSECHHLETYKEAATEAMRDLAMKYANILGHQNHRQKIRHMVKLKEQNLELKEVVQKLECQVRSMKRTIEKLRKDSSATLQKRPGLPHQSVVRKENLVHSPVRSNVAHSSVGSGKGNVVRSPAQAAVGKENVAHGLGRTGGAHQSTKESLVHSPTHNSPVASPNLKPLGERLTYSNVV